jgi:GNAT superfamily N-acetyltransferase
LSEPDHSDCQILVTKAGKMQRLNSEVGELRPAKHEFVDAHAPDWVDKAMYLTMHYFEWMDQEIRTTCGFSIPDIVGMPLPAYIQSVADTICPNVPNESIFYLLVVDDVAIGMGGLRRLSQDSAEIVRIYLDPKYRGCGYGSKMVDRLIDDARQFGYVRLYLDTGEFMKSAHRIYESYGFEICAPYEGAEPPKELHPYWRFMVRSLID